MEDEKILDLYWARDEHAIAETENKYCAYCGVIARNILADREDEEECLSDTWLRAWNSIPPKRPLRLSSYLGAITRNYSINMLKKRKQRPLFFDELEECIPSGESTDDFDEKELEALLNSFLRSISKVERYVFLRRYWYCDSISQIAFDAGFSESKVKSMLFRLRGRLKKELAKGGVLV
ncbi:MAG: RNA polymerase sigma factor [Oscillospiraceae bacterium]